MNRSTARARSLYLIALLTVRRRRRRLMPFRDRCVASLGFYLWLFVVVLLLFFSLSFTTFLSNFFFFLTQNINNNVYYDYYLFLFSSSSSPSSLLLLFLSLSLSHSRSFLCLNSRDSSCLFLSFSRYNHRQRETSLKKQQASTATNAHVRARTN